MLYFASWDVSNNGIYLIYLEGIRIYPTNWLICMMLCIRLVSELEDLECVDRAPREVIHTRTLKNWYLFCWWVLVAGVYPSCCIWRLACMGRQNNVYHNHSPMEIKLGRRCMAQRRWGIFQDLLLGKMNGHRPRIGLVDCQENREREVETWTRWIDKWFKMNQGSEPVT